MIVPALTFVATLAAVTRQEACRSPSISMRTTTGSARLRSFRDRPGTRGLLPVHLYGRVADMQALAALAETGDLIVVEDACQAHGALAMGTARARLAPRRRSASIPLRTSARSGMQAPSSPTT